MLLSLTVLITVLPIIVLGGEFPVHNGVVGGAPINIDVDERVPEIIGDDSSAKVGGLRYVENSGVCGMTPLQKLLPTRMLITRQKPHPASTQLQAMRT